MEIGPWLRMVKRCALFDLVTKLSELFILCMCLTSNTAGDRIKAPWQNWVSLHDDVLSRCLNFLTSCWSFIFQTPVIKSYFHPKFNLCVEMNAWFIIRVYPVAQIGYEWKTTIGTCKRSGTSWPRAGSSDKRALWGIEQWLSLYVAYGINTC